jgi:hypothetical protein
MQWNKDISEYAALCLIEASSGDHTIYIVIISRVMLLFTLILIHIG